MVSYLSEIWVNGNKAYASKAEAKLIDPDSEPTRVVYVSKTIPKSVAIKQTSKGPSFRTVLANTWEQWEKYGNKSNS